MKLKFCHSAPLEIHFSMIFPSCFFFNQNHNVCVCVCVCVCRRLLPSTNGQCALSVRCTAPLDPTTAEHAGGVCGGWTTTARGLITASAN